MTFQRIVFLSVMAGIAGLFAGWGLDAVLRLSQRSGQLTGWLPVALEFAAGFTAAAVLDRPRRRARRAARQGARSEEVEQEAPLPQAGLQPPEVELVCQDGRVIACAVTRDPAMDRPEGDPRGHVVYYRAVPGEPVERDSFEVRVTACHPHTAFWVDIPRVGPGLSSLMDQETS